MKIETASEFRNYGSGISLPKEEIVGDNSVVNQLESLVTRFVLGVNNNRFVLLHGHARSGKTELARYLGAHASAVARTEGISLSVVSFDVRSVYQDGNLMKFLDQVDELRNNKEKKYLIIQEEFDASLNQSDPRLASEVCRFVDDDNINNYLLLGVANQIENIAPRLRDRCQIFYREGAKSADQKADLLRYHLHPELNPDRVEISDEEFGKLGQLAYDLNLTGGDLTSICRFAEMGTINQDAVVMILKAGNSGRLKGLPKIQSHKITYDILEKIMVNHAKGPEHTFYELQTP